MTINSANFIYFLCLQKVLEITPKEKARDMMNALLEGFIQLHEGKFNCNLSQISRFLISHLRPSGRYLLERKYDCSD